MLRTLLESRGRSPRRRLATFSSVAAHTVLIGALVMVRASDDAAASKPVATSVVYFPPRQPPTPRERPTSPSVAERTQFPRTPIISPIDVTIDDIVARPGTLRPILPDFRTGSLTVRDTLAEREPTLQGEIHSELAVDQPVKMIAGQRPPRYPLGLERAGIAGDVIAQFVVDTAGRVEPGSIVIQHATHAEFARAVQDRLHALRFVPARARSRAVRQLVEQRFHFEVAKR